MSPFPVRPPAARAAVVAYLRGAGFTTSGRYDEGVTPQLVVSQVGSSRDQAAPVVFETDLLIEAYAATNTSSEDLAADAYAALTHLQHQDVTDLAGDTVWVQATRDVTGLVDYPDIGRDLPRWQFVAGVRVRGSAAADAP